MLLLCNFLNAVAHEAVEADCMLYMQQAARHASTGIVPARRQRLLVHVHDVRCQRVRLCERVAPRLHDAAHRDDTCMQDTAFATAMATAEQRTVLTR